MEIQTYDGILIGMCDWFDSLISPKKIARVNSNIIYLIFKGIAKGYEIINNVCVALHNKFDPMFCSEEDLDSVATLVGTERNKGSASGLHIFIKNEGVEQTLLKGIYKYVLNDSVYFEFEILNDTLLATDEQIDLIAMSNVVNRVTVTAQTDIAVESNVDIPEEIKFSCSDNSNLLGLNPETSIEFRKRINTDTRRQNTVHALEDYIRNLPYVFDCQIKFNQSDSNMTVDGITVPPFSAVIFYSGEIKNELAEKIADRIIFPTVSTDNSVELTYENDVFIGGEYKVNIVPFTKEPYNVKIHFKADEKVVNLYDVKERIKSAMFINFVAEKHQDYIKEDDIYNVIENLDLSGFEILGIDLVHNGSEVSYFSVPASRIAELNQIVFVQE